MDDIIRPAAVLGIVEAAAIVRALQAADVGNGGVWSATPGMWQRFDRPWNGLNGSRGTAVLVGSIAVVYDSPRRNEILIFRATVTAAGHAVRWTTESLCDDALRFAGLTLATCPRATLDGVPRRDPFHVPTQRGEPQVPSRR